MDYSLIKGTLGVILKFEGKDVLCKNTTEECCGSHCAAFEILEEHHHSGKPTTGSVVLHCCKRVIKFEGLEPR
jgi:hypothetical protein